MEPVAIFLVGLASFALVLCPVAGLVLLVVLLRRQGDLSWDMNRLADQLDRLQSRLDTRREGVQPAKDEPTTKLSAEDAPPSPNGIEASPQPLLPTLSAPLQAIPPPVPASALAMTVDSPCQTRLRGKTPDSSPPAGTSESAAGPPADGELERASKKLLRKLWNGFLFGSDSLPEGVALEHAIATHWLLRIGILIGVLGIGFFLKYSLERNWLDDTARCVLSTITGLAMVVVGIKLAGRKFHLLGLGLIGGGFVVLYWSVYAAAVVYAMVPHAWALPMLVVVTVAAGFMAVRLHSPLVAVIGIVGGYGSPILMSMHDVDVVGILLYMLILSGGILGMSCWRNWHPLNYLGLAFTYGIALALQGQFANQSFWHIMPFPALYFAIYATAMYIHNFLRQRQSTLVELAGQALNSLLFFVLAGALIRANYAQEYVGVLTLALAAFFLLHVFIFLTRGLQDRPLLVVLIALAAFYLTITMPIALSANWLTVAWAMQALVMLWAARKLNSPFLRKLAYLLYGITVFRLVFFDLEREFGRLDMPSPSDYWQALSTRFAVFLMPIFSMFAAFWLQKEDRQTRNRAGGLENPLPAPAAAATRGLFFWAAILFAFLYLNLEFNRLFGALFDPFRPAGLTLIWIALCGYLAYRVNRQDSAPALPLLLVAIVGLAVKFAVFDLPFWDFEIVYFTCGGGAYEPLDAGLRTLDFALVLALFFTLAGGVRPSPAELPWRAIFGGLGIGLLFFYLTLELNTVLGVYKEGFRPGAISILWSLFAITLLFAGLKRDRPPLRYAGLALFAVVAVKIFLVDLGKLDPLYRIVAFIVLGAVVTGGAFVYLYFRQPAAAIRRKF